MDKQLVEALKEICITEKMGVLITILKTKGSTPRKAGAKMLITSEGQVIGTIGGGCGEAEVKREALNAFNDLTPRKYVVNMTQDMAAEEGMVCGGVMEVLIEILHSGRKKGKEVIKYYLEALENNEQPTMVTVIDKAVLPQMDIVGKFFFTVFGNEVTNNDDAGFKRNISKWTKLAQQESRISLQEVEAFELFIEPAPAAVDLIVLGGGHIALPLCNIAKTLGYRVIVVDDRPSFANEMRFKQADRVICEGFVQAIERLRITSNTFIVIVTRGHQHDKACLKAVIDKPAAYIGMIGSKRRVKALMGEMLGEGIPSETVAKVHSPIGLDIGGETPEEIAISILAEIIKVHRIGAT